MKILNKTKFILVLLLIILMQFIFIPTPKTYAVATSPDLGQAASFSVLAALSMSAAGAGTTVSGDLGLSPGLEISKTGSWTVGGSEYFGTGGLSADAQADALIAFNDLAGQTSDGAWGTSPWSPVPGVWTDTSSPAFTGTITLDGDYDDIWVFQVSTDFTFSGSVVLAGNAQACNVFWQVARDATIASGSNFVGTLIASRDITLVSGATVDGQIISLNGALTTDGNTISGPTCTAAPTSTPSPTATDTPTSTPTSTLTPTLTPTPTSTSSSTSSSSSSSSSSSTVYPALNYVSPVIIESRRVDADSIFISWGPYSGINTFNVRYGLTNGNWLYNTNVTGFSITINALPLNQPIWVQVAARNDHAIGIYGEPKFVGGPRLPNTGYTPYQNNISLHSPLFYLTNGLYKKQVGQSQIQSFTQHLETKKQKESQGFPVRLKIPKINVYATIEYVGLTSEGEMEVPSNIVNVGWFDLGPRPGEKGSAVIAGHLNGENSETGIFTNLYKLKKEDKLYIEDSKGTSIAFVVRESRTYDPGHADDVFSQSDKAHLNLITCDGVWDGAKKNYSKRLVVFSDIMN